MSAPSGAATERLSRALVRLLPRSAREDYGDAVVQLAKDRRRHGGEPIWRLWPSLVVDATSTAARTHREEAMPRIPAPAIGLVFAIAAFAVLSSSPAVGLALAALGGLALWFQRGRIATRPDGSHHAARWALAGLALVAIAFGVMAWSTDDQLDSAPAWSAVIATLIAGLTALGTAAVLAVVRRSTAEPTTRPAA